MFSRILAFVAVMVGLLSLAGCSSPRLDHIAVRVEDIKPAGDNLVLTLRFINTNNIPLVISSASHTLTLNGQRVGSVNNKIAVGVPPLGTTTQDTQLSATLAKSIRTLTARDPSQTTYQLESSLQIAWEDDTVTYKTGSRGNLALKSLANP